LPSGEFNWMKSHASIPFAECMEGDIFKIYFSSRNEENKSLIGYIIIDIKKPNEIIRVSDSPIISLGKLGTFDENGTMLSWVTKYNNMSYMYYIGWNIGVTVPFRNSIGLAISSERNANFKKYSEGPLIDRSLIDPYFVASCCILKEQDLWRMWYLSCERWESINGNPKHWYHIKYATSMDGINWNREGEVSIDFNSNKEFAISRPSVIKDSDGYKMWYSYRTSENLGFYRIGYAESNDGISWERKDGDVGIDVSCDGWDSESIEYPHVFEHKNQIYMLYNGNGYGETGFGMAILER